MILSQRQAEEKAKQEEQQRQEAEVQRQAEEQTKQEEQAKQKRQESVQDPKNDDCNLSPESGITCEHVKQEWENEQKIEAELKAKEEERKAQEAEYNKSHQLSQDVANKLVIGTNFMKYDSLLPLPSDAQTGIDGTQIYIYKQGNKQIRMTVNKHDKITDVSYTE
ncbi:hypothetical protein [Bacillus sp. C1]